MFGVQGLVFMAKFPEFGGQGLNFCVYDLCGIDRLAPMHTGPGCRGAGARYEPPNGKPCAWSIIWWTMNLSPERDDAGNLSPVYHSVVRTLAHCTESFVVHQMVDHARGLTFGGLRTFRYPQNPRGT